MTEEQTLEKEAQEKGAFVESEAVHAAGGVPFGVTSFAELIATRKAELAADAVQSAASQMQNLIHNIMLDDDIDDKGAAIGSLSKEFVTLVREEMADAQAKETASELTLKEAHYKEVAKDDNTAGEEDFQGGCKSCGFGEPAIMKSLDKCPFCWNKPGGVR